MKSFPSAASSSARPARLRGGGTASLDRSASPPLQRTLVIVLLRPPVHARRSRPRRALVKPGPLARWRTAPSAGGRPGADWLACLRQALRACVAVMSSPSQQSCARCTGFTTAAHPCPSAGAITTSCTLSKLRRPDEESTRPTRLSEQQSTRDRAKMRRWRSRKTEEGNRPAASIATPSSQASRRNGARTGAREARTFIFPELARLPRWQTASATAALLWTYGIGL